MQDTLEIKRFGRLVGGSRRMRKIYSMIRKGAAVDMPVLIVGETGSGKGLVAQELHDRSARHNGPYVAFNTGAISSELVASELFGHTKGSFTGAVEDKKGLLREASGGSLFLDEIGTMEARMQVSLLRALDEKVIRPIGAGRDVPTDFRLIAATNEDLEAAVKAGRFRDDLLYRLQVLCIQLPPLRHRTEDIPMLCMDFLRNIHEEYGFDIDGISDAAMIALKDYEWPGNLRELKNVLAQASVNATAGTIDIQHLPGHIGEHPGSDFDADPRLDAIPHVEESSDVGPSAPPPFDDGLNTGSFEEGQGEDGVFIPVGTTLEEVQRAYTLKTLASCNNNKTQAAKLLNVSRKALYDKLVRWGEAKNFVQ